MATPTRGSEAYVEPKQAKIVPLKPNKKQAKAQQRRSRIQSLLNTAVTLALAGLVITSLGMMVAGRVRITEMDAQITTQQEQLSNLQSEHVRLTSELAAKTSAQSVEDYATGTLGMQKVDPGQIEYITVQAGSFVCSRISSKQTFFDRLPYGIDPLGKNSLTFRRFSCFRS